MNKRWILSHLREAQEEFARTIAKLGSGESVGEVEFEIATAHIYNHLNTAWNAHGADRRADRGANRG